MRLEQRAFRKEVARFLLAASPITILPIITPSQYVLNVLILAQIYAVYVASWDLLAGYAGQVSLGHALFFGVSAYSTAAFTTLFRVPAWSGYALAILATSLLGCGVGLLSRKLAGGFLAIATLAAAEIAYQLSLSGGIVTAEGYSLGGEGGLPVAPLFPSGSPYPFHLNYYFALGLMLLSLVALRRLAASKVGLFFRAIREDEVAAEHAGVDTARYKLLSFALSAVFAGLAGGFYAHYVGRATPFTLSVELSFTAIILTIVAGRASIFRPAAAAFAVTVLLELLQLAPVHRLLTYSVLLILALRLAPEGLLTGRGVLRRLLKWRRSLQPQTY